MKCISCEYFYIRQKPISEHFDAGLAECKKHNLIIDYVNNAHIKRLECVEKEGSK